LDVSLAVTVMVAVMISHHILCTAAIAVATYATAAEQQPAGSPSFAIPAQRVEISEPSFVIAPGTSVLDPKLGLPDPKLLTAIANWLSANFDLPPLREAPKIVLVPPSHMAALRQRDVPSDRWSTQLNSDVIAVYDDEMRTIFLPDTWSGKTPAELSVLVHETVHHMQNEAHIKFGCNEAREEAAFAAQEKWLALFGEDLPTAFGIDPLTRLVRTNCPP
jgi:hypothetical protein